MKLLSFWSDPMWRALRIASFVTGAITLILLAIVLLGATSFRFPLAAAVVLNIVAAIVVVVRTYQLHAQQRQSPKS